MHCAVYNIAHQSGSCIFYVYHSTALHSMYSNFFSLILINIALFKPRILTKNDMMFNGRLISTHYNSCNCILVHTTLNMWAE
jgi:hypothetical protein